ncbi:MAG: hypothetical protein PVI57_15795 [Gemmatimonadota bacterium]|jgi:uncharacterized protein (DUF302 family)
MRILRPERVVLPVLLAALTVLPTPLRADDDDPRVYLRLAEGIPQPFDDVAETLEDALAHAGWTVLATMDCGVVEDRCDFRSRVVVAFRDAHRTRLLAYGNHAAFALPVRFVVYEDENGVGIGATNPMNLNRTIVDESTEPEDWADMAADIREVVAGAFPDHLAEDEYGQRRGDARIGRTFGIMAGGEFTGKFKEVVTRPAGGIDASSVARRIFEELPTEGDWEWQIRPVYVLDLPENDMALVGVTGRPMETRAAGIVKHGGIDEREGMACPGIDHAAAFPIEVSVAVVGEELQVRLVDVMFRMKMYFEDAGKMAFAKNMGMPGSIEDEIKDKIRLVLDQALAEEPPSGG